MRKILVLTILSILMLFGIVIYEKALFSDHKLHIIFCNVGQGDAIFIRTPSGKDMLIDGGPDEAVLSCLSRHMPFWDRQLELVFLTHPHADHFLGLISVLQRYRLLHFYTEKLENKTGGFAELLHILKEKGLTSTNLYLGDQFKTNDGVRIKVLGPSKEYLMQTSPGGTIGESAEFASLILHISYGEFDVITTGDSQVAGLSEALQSSFPSIEVLQVPHHGSKYGLDSGIVETINPKLAVISVGRNRYGHPSKEVLNLLGSNHIKTLRTDLPALQGKALQAGQNGDVEIISDGKIIQVE